jgi:hypothetical protein
VDFISRVDVTAGGGIPEFYFHNVQLGMFSRRHRGFGGVVLNAVAGQLHLQNLYGPTNQGSGEVLPGVDIELQRAGSAAVDLVPFDLSPSNAVLLASATGTSAGASYSFLGSLSLRNAGDHIEIGNEQSHSTEHILEIRSGGTLVESVRVSASEFVSVPTNALVKGVRLQSRTVEALAGAVVRFAQPVAIVRHTNTSSLQGDEIRFLLPQHVRFEQLDNLQLMANALDRITITNETVVAAAGPPTLEIARGSLDSIRLSWLDPNRLYVVDATVPPYLYFQSVDGQPVYGDPAASMIVPNLKTNDMQWFRLRYYPGTPTGD